MMMDSNKASPVTGVQARFTGRVLRRWWAVIIGLLLANQALVMVRDSPWHKVSGHEYLWIARSLAEGHGYSFPAFRRWMFQERREWTGEPPYSPTAWKEPLYTGWIALWIHLTGLRTGTVVVAVFQVAAKLGLCWAVAQLGRRLFDQTTGLTAATLIAASMGSADLAAQSVHPAVPGAMLGVVLMLLLLRTLEKPSPGRALGLGVALGLSALTLAPLLLTSLVMAAALAWQAVRTRSRGPLVALVIVALTSAATISPWTIRNYRTFGHVIPIQTGLGNFLLYGNAYLAETYTPELRLHPDGSPPPWTSTGPWDAVNKVRERDHNTQLINRSLDAVVVEAPPGWEQMNEHERDQVHQARAVAFIRSHPGLFFELMVSKMVKLYFWLPPVLLPLNLMALAGLVMALRRPWGWTVPATAVAMTLPLWFTIPVFYRYRFPAEPMITLLASVAVVALVRAWRGRKREA